MAQDPTMSHIVRPPSVARGPQGSYILIRQIKLKMSKLTSQGVEVTSGELFG